METENRLSGLVAQLKDKLNDQVWFQQLRSKWDELDPRSRLYLQIAAAALSLLLVIGMVGSKIWSVRSLKSELAEKQDLLQLIQSANDEIRRLRDASGGKVSGAGAGPWPDYFQSTAAAAGLPPETVSVANEKPLPSPGQLQETSFDIQLKKVNVRQLMRYAYQVENGGRTVKLKNLAIDTGNEDTGWLNATLSVSAFSAKN